MESSATKGLVTECERPPELSDEALLDALSGHASAQTRDHLNSCRFCSGKLGEMRWFEKAVSTLMFRSECPSPDQLADYAMGTLDRKTVRAIEEHLKYCTLCADEVETLRSFFELEAVPESVEEVSVPFLEQMKQLFQAVDEQLVHVLRPEMIPAYGQKKGGQDKRIQTFTDRSVSLMLTLEKHKDQIKVEGTIIDTKHRDEWSNGAAEFVGTGEDKARFLALIDDYDTFTLPAVPASQYRINIYSVNGSVLRLENIEITF